MTACKDSTQSGWRKNSFLCQREYHVPLWQESCLMGGAPFFSNHVGRYWQVGFGKFYMQRNQTPCPHRA